MSVALSLFRAAAAERMQRRTWERATRAIEDKAAVLSHSVSSAKIKWKRIIAVGFKRRIGVGRQRLGWCARELDSEKQRQSQGSGKA